jgi:hypothetical protein
MEVRGRCCCRLLWRCTWRVSRGRSGRAFVGLRVWEAELWTRRRCLAGLLWRRRFGRVRRRRRRPPLFSDVWRISVQLLTGALLISGDLSMNWLVFRRRTGLALLELRVLEAELWTRRCSLAGRRWRRRLGRVRRRRRRLPLSSYVWRIYVLAGAVLLAGTPLLAGALLLAVETSSPMSCGG